MRPARRSWSTTCSRRRSSSSRSSSAPTAWSIPRPSISTARAAASAASSWLGKIHPGPRSQSDPPDRPVVVAVQRLGAAQGAGDALPCACAGRPTPRRRSRSRSSEHPKVSRLIYPGRPDHPQAEIAHRQMRGGSTLVAFEVEGGEGRRLPLPGRAQARPHQQQSRRREEPDHPPGDDDASAAHAGAARRARHQRRPGAAVVRPGTSRRYRRGPAHRARRRYELRADTRGSTARQSAFAPASLIAVAAWRPGRAPTRSRSDASPPRRSPRRAPWRGRHSSSRSCASRRSRRMSRTADARPRASAASARSGERDRRARPWPRSR